MCPERAKATHGLAKTDLLQLLNFLQEFFLQQFLLLLEFEDFLSLLLLHAFGVLRTWSGGRAGRFTEAPLPSSLRDKGLRGQSCSRILVLFLFSLFLNIMKGNREALHMLLGIRKSPVRKMSSALCGSVMLEDPIDCFTVQAHTRRHFFSKSEGRMIPELVPLNISLGGKQARQ